MAQPTDGADLSPLRRPSLSLLGDRCAAGFRCNRCSLAREIRGNIDARLGTDCARWRERLHRGRSTESRSCLWWRRSTLEPRDQRAGRIDDSATVTRAGARRLDTTAGILAVEQEAPVLRQPARVQD